MSITLFDHHHAARCRRRHVHSGVAARGRHGCGRRTTCTGGRVAQRRGRSDPGDHPDGGARHLDLPRGGGLPVTGADIAGMIVIGLPRWPAGLERSPSPGAAPASAPDPPTSSGGCAAAGSEPSSSLACCWPLPGLRGQCGRCSGCGPMPRRRPRRPAPHADRSRCGILPRGRRRQRAAQVRRPMDSVAPGSTTHSSCPCACCRWPGVSCQPPATRRTRPSPFAAAGNRRGPATLVDGGLRSGPARRDAAQGERDRPPGRRRSSTWTGYGSSADRPVGVRPRRARRGTG